MSGVFLARKVTHQQQQETFYVLLTPLHGFPVSCTGRTARPSLHAVAVQAPTRSPLLEGRWKLLYTTRPGTASPIQRTFTGVDAFSVFQASLF